MLIEVAGAVVVAVLLWWASTGAILYLDGLPRQTFKWSLFGVCLLGIVAVFAIAQVRGDLTNTSAYVAFVGGLLVWAVPTAGFYFGVVTGPRRTPLPSGMKGWARFRAAVETMLYHEALCAACALLLALVLWSAPNQLALWTYLLLWAMHVSGKLNMFFGVPNLSEEFLPDHLAHLATYMRAQPMNLLFPISVSLATIGTAALAAFAWMSPAGSHEAVGATLLAVLSGLAVLEHWLLVLPLSPMALWTWSLRSRQVAQTPPAPTEPAFRRPGV